MSEFFVQVGYWPTATSKQVLYLSKMAPGCPSNWRSRSFFNASRYLSRDEPLAVRRHGRVLGFYVPVKQKSDAEELRAALREARDSLAELRRATGLSEEELVEGLVSGESKNQGRERVGG